MDIIKMFLILPGGTARMTRRASKIAVPNRATITSGFSIMASTKSGIFGYGGECNPFCHLTAGE